MAYLGKLQVRRVILLTILTFLCSCTHAEVKTAVSTNPITSDNINLSAKVFLKEFVSQNDENRKAARLYLLGVMDATEGKDWCDYKQFSTATLNEFVFEYFKARSQAELEQRAAKIIEDALRLSFPCKDKK